jgi:hypothetical protein
VYGWPITPRPGPPPLKVVALLLVGAVGLATVFLSVFDSTSWLPLLAGVAALVGSLGGLWMTQKDRDRLLR